MTHCLKSDTQKDHHLCVGLRTGEILQGLGSRSALWGDESGGTLPPHTVMSLLSCGTERKRTATEPLPVYHRRRRYGVLQGARVNNGAV